MIRSLLLSLSVAVVSVTMDMDFDQFFHTGRNTPPASGGEPTERPERPASASSTDPTNVLSVTIPVLRTQRPLLGEALLLPCYFTERMFLDPGAPEVLPYSHLIKWTHVTPGKVTTILVALERMVSVDDSYLDRVHLLGYYSNPTDATISISGLRSSDSGLYRCEVQLGLFESHSLVHVQVQGVLFHYQSLLGRHTLDFETAKVACEINSAVMASPEQLQAAYDDGFHRCDAGWLSDGTIRYPISDLGLECYGETLNLPGVQTYGVRNLTETYDVYCFAEKMKGWVSHQSSAERFTFSEAEAVCATQGARLASTGELSLAWKQGLSMFNTGWLLDGSVRYAINIQQPQCGESLPGSRTVYHYTTVMEYPLLESRYDVFCFTEFLGGEGSDSVDGGLPEQSTDVPEMQNLEMMLENKQFVPSSFLPSAQDEIPGYLSDSGADLFNSGEDLPVSGNMLQPGVFPELRDLTGSAGAVLPLGPSGIAGIDASRSDLIGDGANAELTSGLALGLPFESGGKLLEEDPQIAQIRDLASELSSPFDQAENQLGGSLLDFGDSGNVGIGSVLGINSALPPEVNVLEPEYTEFLSLSKVTSWDLLESSGDGSGSSECLTSESGSGLSGSDMSSSEDGGIVSFVSQDVISVSNSDSQSSLILDHIDSVLFPDLETEPGSANFAGLEEGVDMCHPNPCPSRV